MAPERRLSSPPRVREERRFEPVSATPVGVVAGAGGVGALAFGAGVYGQFLRAMGPQGEPMPGAQWVLIGGAIVTGATLWFASSSDPVVRVGDGGVAVEKDGVRRIPWHAIEAIAWDGSAGVLTVRGVDDTGASASFALRRATQGAALGRLLKEASRRIGATVSIPSLDSLGALPSSEGERVELDAVQVVGKRCAASGTVIAYEPDARVCPQCERVYHKAHTPAACACGYTLAARGSVAPTASAMPDADDPGSNTAQP